MPPPRRRRELLPLLLVGLAVLAAAARPALAGSDTDQLTVTVTVQSGCSLRGGTLDFGRYVSGQPTDLDAVGTIEFADCSGNLVIELDGGGSGEVAARQLRFGGHRLRYQIYRNPVRTAILGMGLDAREINLLTPQSGSVTIYGRIPRSQAVPDGVYTDVVNVTLAF